ncbi:MAG: hypothetical protein ACUVQ0_04730 [Thermoproteota archaeon]
MIEDYVSRIEEACGAGKTKDYVVIIKHDKKDEAVRMILDKVRVLTQIGKVAVKASFMNRELTVFMNGRLMFKSLKDRDELDSILRALFG